MKKLLTFITAALLAGAALAQSSSSSMPAPGLMPRGSATLPGMYFAGDRDTGIFWSGANEIGLSAGGVRIGRLSASTDLGVGANALLALTTGVNNTGFGYQSLQSVTSGNENTAAGYLALGSVTGGVDPAGSYNTAIGSWALALNTTGYKNTAGGRASMDNLTTGSQNAAWGYGSMHWATTAVNNTAVGFEAVHGGAAGPFANQGVTGVGFRALYSAVTGADFNTAVGTSAATNITTGPRNTAVGTNALNQVTTANDNTAIGYGAGLNALGAGNIFVGAGADDSAPYTHANVTVIGSSVTAPASNLMVLGNDQTLIPGSASEDLGSQTYGAWGYGIFNKTVYAWQGTAIPAGGTTGTGFTFSSTGNFGIFFGSGAPTLSGARGSLYLRSDGTTNQQRLYINTDGGTGWWGDFASLAGTETLTNKTLTTPVLTLEQGVAPAQTAEGRIQWDTVNDRLVVGTGAGTATFRQMVTATATYDPASLAAGSSRTDTVTVTGITTTGGAVTANAGIDNTTSCVVASVRASAANTVSITWRNATDTVTACDVPSSTWTFSQPQ